MASTASLKLQPPTQKDREATLRAWFSEGSQLHKNDKLDEAEVYYRAILKAQPNNLDAKHLLCVLKTQQGQYDEALKLIRQVLAANHHMPIALTNQGNILAKLGRLAEALSCYEKAVAIKPDYTEANNNRAVMLLELRRAEEALACCDQAIAANPGFVDAYYNRGNALKELKRLEEAKLSYERTVAIKPDHAEAYNNLGVVLKDLKRTEEALDSYNLALRYKPDYPEALNNRGVALADLKRTEEAIESYTAALALRPEYPEALNNRGLAFKTARRIDDAFADLTQAIKLKPDYPEAYNNYGQTLRMQQRFEEEKDYYIRALAMRPSYTEALNNYAVVLHELGQTDEALKTFERSLALDGTNEETLFSQSLVQLLAGDLASGWRGYAHRFNLKETGSRPYVSGVPFWAGENLAGKRLIVIEEQGIGDVIQFIRYLPLIGAMGAHVTLMTRQVLSRLFKPFNERSETTNVRVIDRLDTVHYDVQCTLLDLPIVLGTTLETIPAAVPYLAAESDLVARWHDRVGTQGLKIGIAWQGNPEGLVDIGRSIPLRMFEPIARIPGVRLISLQKRHGLEQLASLPEGMQVETLGDDFDNGPDAFVDTAAVMANLDMVITSDTSIAHLAGALGRPTWLALKQIPDWRWLLERTDSPWYPTMRLYRQSRRGDWQEVFQRMAADLTT